MVHVDPTDIIVVLFIDQVDKIHGFMVEAKEAYPFLEVHVFLFDLFDDGRKHRLHLFLKHEHFWDFCVGIFTDNVL